MGLHPILKSAAKGRLPDWTVAGPRRRDHMVRVAGLMAEWAKALGLPSKDKKRWRAAGLLHDVLRDEDPGSLRDDLEGNFLAYPPSAYHGPAAAARLVRSGVEDESVLAAIQHHTLGAADLDTLGLALYAADFLEPGRRNALEWRAELRERMPKHLPLVVAEIVSTRIDYLRSSDLEVRPETAGLLQSLSPS